MQTYIQKFPVVLRSVNQFNPNRPCVSWGFLVMGKIKTLHFFDISSQKRIIS